MGCKKYGRFYPSIDPIDEFNDFGFSERDQARFITQETETLYQTGQVQEFNNYTKQRVLDGFHPQINLRCLLVIF